MYEFDEIFRWQKYCNTSQLQVLCHIIRGQSVFDCNSFCAKKWTLQLLNQAITSDLWYLKHLPHILISHTQNQWNWKVHNVLFSLLLRELWKFEALSKICQNIWVCYKNGLVQWHKISKCDEKWYHQAAPKIFFHTSQKISNALVTDFGASNALKMSNFVTALQLWRKKCGYDVTS